MLGRVGGGAFLLKTHLMSLLIVLAHKIVTKGLKTRCIYYMPLLKTLVSYISLDDILK